MEVQGWVVIGVAFVLFGYLVPHLVTSRQQLAEARVEDRFSGTLRVVTTGTTAKRSSSGEHHGATGSRPYLHGPHRRTEAPAVNRPTTPSERAAAEARRLTAARAARAAEISRRKAAARRRLVLTVVLLLASVGGWLGFGLASASIALGVVPTLLLGAVLVLGRRAAKTAARRNAADRAAMARLELRPAPRTRPTRPAAGATASRASAAGGTARAGDGTAAGHKVTAGAAVTAQPDQGREAAATGRSVTAEDLAAPSSSTETVTGAEGVAASAAGSGAATADAASAAADSATSADAGRATESSAAANDSGWTPVPVPAPSYTLKAAAPRRDIAPYEPPATEPAATHGATMPVGAAGLAGSPYASVADPDPEPEPVSASAPQARPARGMDIDSVLARRRGA